MNSEREQLKRFRAMREQLGAVPTGEEYDAVNEAIPKASGKELADLQLKLAEIKAASEAHQTIGVVLRMTIESVDELTEKEKENHAKKLLAMKRLAVSQCENVKKIRGQMLAIPLVDSALKSKYGYLQRDEVEDQKNFTHTIQELNKTLSTIRTVGEWEACPELACYKKKYSGRDTFRKWIKAAGISLNTGGRPKKKQ